LLARLIPSITFLFFLMFSLWQNCQIPATPFSPWFGTTLPHSPESDNFPARLHGQGRCASGTEAT